MEKKICPVCVTPNEPGAKHCEVCGERLPIPQVSSTTGEFADADAIATTLPTSFEDQAQQPTPTQLKELERFEEQLSAPEPEETPSEAEFAREDDKTTVDTTVPYHVEEARPDPAPVVETSGATVTVFLNRKPAYTHTIQQDETLVGRYDPTSDAYPDLDLTPYDPEQEVSRKHVYLYREGGSYFVYPISNAGTQIGSRLLGIGEKVEIHSGEVIILAGAVAMKFDS